MATQITSNREPNYSDLDLDFMRNPKTDQLIIKTGVDAVKRAVRNLLLTNKYERLFQPYLGSGIRELLFENAGMFTSVLIEDSVRLTLQNVIEPRITLENIEYNGKTINGVKVEEDFDNNGFQVTIAFKVINTNQPVITSLFLERIR